MTTNTPKRPAALARIYSLAAQHGIVAERLSLDDWADKVTELSGDEVVHDPVEDLVVTLQRKGVITAEESTRLYGDYILESSSAKESMQAGRRHVPIREKLANILIDRLELGPYSPGDHKRETDEMWGEED